MLHGRRHISDIWSRWCATGCCSIYYCISNHVYTSTVIGNFVLVTLLYVMFVRWYTQESGVTCVMYVGKHLCISIHLQVTNVSIVEKSDTDVPSVNEHSHRCRPCSSIATRIQGRSHTAVFAGRPSLSSPVLHVIRGNLIMLTL